METNEQQESFDLILQNDTDINKQFDEIIEAADLDSVMITTRRIRANELRGTTIHLIDQLIDDINMEQSLAIEDTSRSINSSITVLSAINIIAIVSGDRKSTRLNSSHVAISYAVFCLKKKNNRRIRSNHAQHN